MGRFQSLDPDPLMSGKLCLIALVLILQSIVRTVVGTELVGINGRVVDFFEVLTATPTGLGVRLKKDDQVQVIEWGKLDISWLEKNNREIFLAYQKALEGDSVDLMVVGDSATPPSGLPEERAKLPGRHMVESGDSKFWIQLPVQGEPRAILLLAMGQDGYSFRYLGQPDRSRWKEISSKFNLAVMAYSFPVNSDQSREFGGAEFVFADKGSGKALLSAIDSIALKAEKPVLSEIPLVIYGQDALGGGFAYNFLQAFPERVIAAVAVNGTFYSAAANESSAKVPFAFVWGEYDDEVKRWRTDDGQQKAYREALSLRPNWVSAMELRGAGGESPQSSYFAMMFLDRMLLARLRASGEVLDLDRSRAFIGDLRSLKISRVEDVEASLDEEQTWLPDGEIGRLWEDLANGRLQIPGKEE